MGEVRKKFLTLERLPLLVPIVFFILYSMGYSYLKSFYTGIGISFEYYINLIDILFYTVDYLIKVVFLFLLIEGTTLCLYYVLKLMFFEDMVFALNKRITNNRFLNLLFKVNKIRYFSNYQELLYLLLLFLIFIGLLSAISGKSTNFRELILVSPFIAGKFVFLLNREKIKNGEGMLVLVILTFYIMGFIALSGLGSLDSATIKENREGVRISFFYNGKNYSTNENDSPNVYIGETSNYLFLHDVKNNSTLSFRKEAIELMEIYPNDTPSLFKSNYNK